MPWASYFTGGIALHEYPIVPTYPASHGCVRVNRYDAPFLYEFATYGTPVVVLPSSMRVRSSPRPRARARRDGSRSLAATKRPGELTVALSLPAPALQVGAVRGSDVVLARGLEVDVARAVARRLGLRLRLVQVGDARRLLRPGRRGWDAALAQLVATPTRTRVSSFTTPYSVTIPSCSSGAA